MSLAMTETKNITSKEGCQLCGIGFCIFLFHFMIKTEYFNSPYCLSKIYIVFEK